MIRLFLVLILLLSGTLFASLEKSVVRINSTLELYDYKQPWKSAKRKNIIGSGVIIENQYILTAAHVVSNAKVIEIKKSSNSKKYFANIKYISYQSDLALLELYDKKFFNDTKALKINSKVKIADKIKIAGYPLSRNDLLTKNGVLTKIEYNSYSFSNENLLALKLKVDAKPGNSGGPVLNKDRDIVGISMQIPKSSQNISYAIPSSIINTFLDDIKDKKVDGFHSNSNSYQYLENSALQKYYKTKKSGMLVTDIDIKETQLKIDDIILKINGYDLFGISEDEFLFQFHTKPIGESISLSVLRDEKIHKIDYKLNYSKKFIHQEFASKPRYFVFAGLVFTPITRNYLKSLDMKQYEMNMLFYQQKRMIEKEEPVAWMETKFLDNINKGYISKVEIVDRVNGIKVKSFSHFVNLIADSEQKYIVIDFIKKQRVVLEKEEAIKSFHEIQKKYKIASDRRL